MIRIKDNPTSNYYADICSPNWMKVFDDFDYFDAITPKNMPSYLSFDINRLAKYSRHDIRKPISDSEKAIWYSHYTLWRECANDKIPYIIVEHDSYLFQNPINKIQELMNLKYCKVYYDIDMLGQGAYYITPAFAQELLNRFIGLIDSSLKGCIDYAIKHNEIQYDYYKPNFNKCNTYACQIVDWDYGFTNDRYSNLTEKERELVLRNNKTPDFINITDLGFYKRKFNESF